MFILHQKVILPDSHGNREGTITLIPKQITKQEGITQQTKRVKVSYTTLQGGMTEVWFPTEGDKAITPYVSVKDMTAELEAKHQKEMEKINAIHDREKLDWITCKEEKIVYKNQRGEDIEGNEEVPSENKEEQYNKEVLEPKADTNIVDELAVLNAKKGMVTDRSNDNSDVFQG